MALEVVEMLENVLVRRSPLNFVGLFVPFSFPFFLRFYLILVSFWLFLDRLLFFEEGPFLVSLWPQSAWPF